MRTKQLLEGESQAVRTAEDLRARGQTHRSRPGRPAHAGKRGAETSGEVSGAEAELTAQRRRGRLNARETWSQNLRMSRRARELRTGRSPSRAPWGADAGDGPHPGRRETAHRPPTSAPQTRRGGHVHPAGRWPGHSSPRLPWAPCPESPPPRRAPRGLGTAGPGHARSHLPLAGTQPAPGRARSQSTQAGVHPRGRSRVRRSGL